MDVWYMYRGLEKPTGLQKSVKRRLEIGESLHSAVDQNG